jgi:polyisoprenoid-binding protein YceI
MEFRSTSLEATGQGTYRATGDLTIRGATHPVTLAMQVAGPIKDPWGNEKMAFSLDGTINRKTWGLEWNVLLEGGGVLVAEDVHLHVEAEAAASAA